MAESQFNFIVQTATMLFLILNPLGNIPAYVGILRLYSPREYRHIVIREMFAGLGILLIFLFFGSNILSLLHISTIALSIAGGIILFMVALKMVFSSTDSSDVKRTKEPFLVPLAFPLFAGPSSITMVIITRGTPDATMTGLLAAVIIAWLPAALILFSGRFIEKILGNKVLDALESLMGFLLTVVAVQMLINGFQMAFPGIVH